jgi:hypothetical protein
MPALPAPQRSERSVATISPPAALRVFEPRQIRKEAALRIPLRCRGSLLPPMPALPASAHSGPPVVEPLEVVMAGRAGRTSSGSPRQIRKEAALRIPLRCRGLSRAKCSAFSAELVCPFAALGR